MLTRGIVRMPFKTEFMHRRYVCFGQNTLNQLSQMLNRKESRCSPAQMNFFNHWLIFQQLTIQIPFFQHCLKIGLFHFMFFRDSLMTPAKSAQAFAKWQMDIQADAFTLIGFSKGFFQSLLRLFQWEILLFPIWNGRITGIAGTGKIIFLNQGIDLYRHDTHLLPSRNAQTHERLQVIVRSLKKEFNLAIWSDLMPHSVHQYSNLKPGSIHYIAK